jgi:hypothetical protein
MFMHQNWSKLLLSALLLCSVSALWGQTKPVQEGPPDNEAEFEKQYQERITKDRLFNVYIPKNLDDAMAQLDKMVPPDAVSKIKNMPEDSIVPRLHNRLGVWLVNNWGFYGGSRLSHYLRSAGVTFPEDMADLLLIAFHRHLNGKSVAMRELAKPFREKRKQEHAEEIKNGKIIKEEKRIREKKEDAPAPAQKPKGGG